MRYQQTPISRLSRASAALITDGSWQPFASEPGVYYRVLDRTMQKVRFETYEDQRLLRLFERIAPLPSRVLKEGFREELHFAIEDDHYLLTDIFVRVFIGWDALARAAADIGIRMTFVGGNSLHCAIRIDSWDEPSIVRALVVSKAFSRVSGQLASDAVEGIPHTSREMSGLLRSAVALYMEELYEPWISKRPAPSITAQEELF